MKTILKRALERITVYRGTVGDGAFRLSLFDIVRSTLRLRHEDSPFRLYERWRASNQDGLGASPAGRRVREEYYGKADRVRILLSALRVVLRAGVDGAVAEFGVFNGTTAVAIAGTLGSRRPLLLFDSFRGLPEPTPVDQGTTYKAGDLAGDLETVQEALQQTDVTFEIIEGFFEHTLRGSDHRVLSFAHVDCDLFDSTVLAIDYILPRLSPGGVIIFDDYGFSDCPGVAPAIARAGLAVIPLPTGQAIFTKLAEK